MLLKAIVVVGVLVPSLNAVDDAKMALVSPAVLHGLAESVTLPDYPSLSYKANRSGVAVVELVVSPTGKVAKAEVLETPDAAIARAVDTAVKEWKFHPFLVGGKPVTFKSRLIFYFRLVKGKPLVIDAVADNPETREQPRQPTH